MKRLVLYQSICMILKIKIVENSRNPTTVMDFFVPICMGLKVQIVENSRNLTTEKVSFVPICMM